MTNQVLLNLLNNSSFYEYMMLYQMGFTKLQVHRDRNDFISEGDRGEPNMSETHRGVMYDIIRIITVEHLHW
jgi:hypothetical protein